ncbi:MAG: LPXTG cell wall anchor domain-containing protein [Candidatus Microsaccharimonas sp.]
MFTPLRTAIFAVVAISSMVMGTLALSGSAHAEMTPAPAQDFLTLEVTPVCADNTAKLAYWKVVNKNAEAEPISWNNFDNGTSGSYTAAPGESEMTTGYDLAAGNNRTGFVWTNNVSSTNSSNTPCQPEEPTVPPVQCIDGSIQQNLVIQWVSNNHVTIKTKDAAPLCDDVTIFFSSYVMPSNYNGQGFYGNPTAYPQYKFSSDLVTLTKGTDGSSELKVELPVSCHNVQLDVYYGPEIETVGSNGHGTQNIESRVLLSDGPCDNGNGNGGGEPTTPVTPVTPTPTTPVVTEPSMGNGAVGGTSPKAEPLPAELPTTGANVNYKSLLVALLAGLMTYGILFAVLPKNKENL